MAKEAATKIDEIVNECNTYFANARDLNKQFREMQQKYKGPNEINLASLAALKECLGNKSEVPLKAQPNNTARGETAVQGISATTLLNAPSGSGVLRSKPW